jgi:hypothetical protein
VLEEVKSLFNVLVVFYAPISWSVRLWRAGANELGAVCLLCDRLTLGCKRHWFCGVCKDCDRTTTHWIAWHTRATLDERCKGVEA